MRPRPARCQEHGLGPVASVRRLSDSRLPDDRATAYLELLGVDAAKGEVGARTLAALARAQVARVPYENIDIYRGQPPGIEPLSCVERVVSGRGGYCYHLNGAFATLLEWLEVDVTRHVSGVQGSAGDDGPRLSANHLGLTARMQDGSDWFVDAGLGDGPSEPLPLVFGAYEEDGFSYELRPSTLGEQGWRFEHDPRGAFVGADFARAPAVTEQFLEKHHELSTSPASGFVRVATIMRRVGGGVEILRGCAHSTMTARGTTTVAVDSEQDWWGIVIDGFGLGYGDLTADERARVWAKVREAHEAWEASRETSGADPVAS